MAITMRLKIGGSEIAVAGKNLKEIIRESSIFHELPCQCGKCDGKNLGFRYRRTKDDDEYYEMVCRDCGATYALGQHKDGDTLFPRGNKETGEWDEKYERRKDRDDDRRDDRRDSRRDDRRDERRNDDRRDSKRDDRRDDQRSRRNAPDSSIDDDNVPFNDRSSRSP